MNLTQVLTGRFSSLSGLMHSCADHVRTWWFKTPEFFRDLLSSQKGTSGTGISFNKGSHSNTLDLIWFSELVFYWDSYWLGRQKMRNHFCFYSFISYPSKFSLKTGHFFVWFRGWHTKTYRPNLAHLLFLYGPWTTIRFYIFLWFKRFKRRIIFCETIQLCYIHISVLRNRDFWNTATLAHWHGGSGRLCAKTAELSCWHRGCTVAKPKVVTLWHFIGKVCPPLLSLTLFLHCLIYS